MDGELRFGRFESKVTTSVAQPHCGLLGASYGIMTYLNPASGSAKSGYLILMNQMVKRGRMDMPDLTCYEYYRDFHHIFLRFAAIRNSHPPP